MRQSKSYTTPAARSVCPAERGNSIEACSGMNIRTVLISCLLMVAPVLARDSTDVIVMKNGDHLTGEIKGYVAGCALHQHELHSRHQPGAMVEGGPHREQAAVPGEDRGWNGVHGDAVNGGNREGPADDDRGGGVVEQADDAGAADGGGDGPDVGTFLAAVQWADQYRNHVYQGKPIDAVQPELRGDAIRGSDGRLWRRSTRRCRPARA